MHGLRDDNERLQPRDVACAEGRRPMIEERGHIHFASVWWSLILHLQQ